MKIAHIRYTLEKALDDFKGGKASATHVLSAIEALIEEKNVLQQERPSFADWTSDYVRDNLHKLKPQPVRQDIPDLIAGTLGVSRGTAYDLMREALAEQPAPVQQEPVAWANPNDLQNFDMKVRINGGPLHTVPLYASPPAQRTWVGLTDEERQACINYRAVEAKLKEKNT